MSVSLTWVDAFTDRPFAGNPAGVCLLEEPLPVSTMQSLATELGIAETAFVTPTDVPGTFGLRWFSPRVEIDLCGHATLAAAHALRAHGVIDGTTPVTFDTRSGALRAAFAGDLIELDFPAETMSEAPLPAALAGEWEAGTVLGAGTSSFFARGDPDRRSGAAPVLGPTWPPSRPPATRHCWSPPPPTPDPGPTTCCGSSGPMWGSTRTRPPGRRNAWRALTGPAVLGRPDMVARQLSPRGAVLHVRPDGNRVHIGGNAVTVFTGHLC